MTRYPPEQTEAVVLRLLDYGDSDRIVTFFTVDHGKLAGFAKSARKSTKRFGNALELFSHGMVFFVRRGGNLVFIEKCDVINHHARIRNDLESTLAASYMAELVERFTIEEKPIPSLFSLFVRFLRFAETGPPSELLLRLFELSLLTETGYKPHLERCVACGTHVDAIAHPLFSPQDGGILCERCAPPSSDAFALSPGTVKMLLMGQRLDLDKLHRLVPSPQSLRESREFMQHFIRYILGRDIQSLFVLNQIRRLTGMPDT